MSKLGFFDILGPAIDTTVGTIDRLNHGENAISAVTKSTVSALAYDTAFSFLLGSVGQWAYLGAQVVGVGANIAIDAGKDKVHKHGEIFSGPGMYNKVQINSKNAQTMRQRGMSMINDNGDIVRSAFGSEARAYFRSTF